MALRYYITLPDPAMARGPEAAFSFTALGAEAFASQLQDALQEDHLFQRWLATQEDAGSGEPGEDEPDGNAGLGGRDPAAKVEGKDKGGHVELVVTTVLPGNVLRHRLQLLAGAGWRLHDVARA